MNRYNFKKVEEKWQSYWLKKKTFKLKIDPNKKKIYLFKMFPLVQAAGGLVENKNKQFLFIYRNNKWDLPKGKIEKKEKISNAAMREVMEETGVKNLKITFS